MGSIIYFPHTHKFNGITITHSHPYKSNPGNDPVSHNHSKDGLLLIQSISDFVSIVPVIFLGILVTRKLLNNTFFNHTETPLLRFYLLSARPRAPTA
jgi:hypothetical protein